MSAEGSPSLSFPRELTADPGESLVSSTSLRVLGFTPTETASRLTLQSRLLRYLVTSPLRRAKELQDVSAYNFSRRLRSRDRANRYPTHPNSTHSCAKCQGSLPLRLELGGCAHQHHHYSAAVPEYPTNPTPSATGSWTVHGRMWFDHWYRHLLALGVRFVRNAVTRLDPPTLTRTSRPICDTRVQIHVRRRYAGGSRTTPGSSPPTPRRQKPSPPPCALRAPAARCWGCEASTNLHPHQARCSPTRPGPGSGGIPYSVDEMGRVPWDRFQTLCGIQYYFDTEFQLLRGHMLTRAPSGRCRRSTNRDFGRSNQFWTATAASRCSRSTSGISMRLPATWSTSPARARRPATALQTKSPQRYGARSFPRSPTATNPSPERRCRGRRGYAIDRGLIMGSGPGQGNGHAIRNETPYLVPIVGDWDNRPSSDPLESTWKLLDSHPARELVALQISSCETSGKPATAGIR